MRMDIAYQRLLKTRTHKEAKRVKERDVAIEELYQQVEKECIDKGKKLLFKYTDEMVQRIRMPCSIREQLLLMSIWQDLKLKNRKRLMRILM